MKQILVNFLFVFFIFFTAHAADENRLQGIVYLDQNKNGRLDTGEQGVPDVLISNGRDVVQTNNMGVWMIAAENAGNVFVIKPAGYNVPLGKYNIPQHHSFTGGNDSLSAYRFGLLPAEEPDSFSVLFFGDTQARGLKEVNYIMHDVVEECVNTSASFGVSLGDIVADDPALFAEVSQGIGQIGIPWYNIFGNHDHDREEVINENKDKTFRKFFGPSTYAFEYGEVAFIGLNNIFFDPDGKYKAHLSGGQLSFIENYLEFVPENKLVVLMMHAPLMRTENRDKLYALLQNREYTFSISGHVHEQINVFIDEDSGWLGQKAHHHLINAVVCGSWWCGLHDELGIPHATMNDGAPNGYSVLTFTGNQYSIRFKAARRPESYQMNIYLPEEITAAEVDTTTALANVFAGSARSVVEMRIGNEGDWITMKQVAVTDPECMRMFKLSHLLDNEVDGQALDEALGYKMDYPSVSTHMWKGELPAGLSEGTHTLTIRTTDMFNQTWTGHRIFRVRSGT